MKLIHYTGNTAIIYQRYDDILLRFSSSLSYNSAAVLKSLTMLSGVATTDFFIA